MKNSKEKQKLGMEMVCGFADMLCGNVSLFDGIAIVKAGGFYFPSPKLYRIKIRVSIICHSNRTESSSCLQILAYCIVFSSLWSKFSIYGIETSNLI